MTQRIGLVGAGYIALRRQLPLWEEIDETELVAIADLDEEAVKEVSREYDIPEYYTDTEEMCRVSKPFRIRLKSIGIK